MPWVHLAGALVETGAEVSSLFLLRLSCSCPITSITDAPGIRRATSTPRATWRAICPHLSSLPAGSGLCGPRTFIYVFVRDSLNYQIFPSLTLSYLNQLKWTLWAATKNHHQFSHFTNLNNNASRQGLNFGFQRKTLMQVGE